MNRYEWLDAVIASDLNDGTKVVGAYLCARANNKTLQCHPKQETIAEVTGRSERSVMRSVKALSDAGFLEVERPDAYAVNTYKLTAPHLTPVSPRPPDTSVTLPPDTSVTLPPDTSVTLPPDTSVTLPPDTSVTSSKQTREQIRGTGGTDDADVAVMKAAADAGSFQVLPSHSKAMLLAAQAAGVADPLAWVLSRIADMKARNVKGLSNAPRLVSMVLQDAKAYEPPPKPPEPLRPMTDAELLEERKKWM